MSWDTRSGGSTTLAVAGGVKEFADPRVLAAIGFSAVANGKAFSTEELPNIKIPVMIMFGSTEIGQGRGDARAAQTT